MLGGCLYAIIGRVLRIFYVYVFLANFSIVLVRFLNWWTKIMNIINVICVSLMTIIQQVIAVYVTEISEFIINLFKIVIFVLEMLA